MRVFHPGRQHLGFPVWLRTRCGRTHGNCHMLLWRISVLKKRRQIKGKEGHREGMGFQHHNAAAMEFQHKLRSLVWLSRPPHAGASCRPDVKIPAGDQPCMPYFSLHFFAEFCNFNFLPTLVFIWLIFLRVTFGWPRWQILLQLVGRARASAFQHELSGLECQLPFWGGFVEQF